jgi:aldehyde dehydrogenase (NAD+)
MPRIRPALSDAPLSAFGKTVPGRPLNPSHGEAIDYHVGDANMPANTPAVDRTYKLYIGGKQARPDAPYTRSIPDSTGKKIIGQVGEGNRKDIRNAVEAAHAAWPGWGKRAAHNRAQIVYYL